jgi:hypothetical protein
MLALAAAAVVTFSPNPSTFGQPVTATVHGAAPSFAPFTVRARDGDTYVLQCLDPACAPGPRPRVVMVQGVKLMIVPRTTAREVARPLASFRRQAQVPPPTYRIRPGLLRVLLLAGVALLIGLSVFALWPRLRRLVPARVDERTPLERALALVRASLRRGGEDRRRALDLLARTLATDPHARDALGLAWSEREPEAAPVEQLIDAVERGA